MRIKQRSCMTKNTVENKQTKNDSRGCLDSTFAACHYTSHSEALLGFLNQDPTQSQSAEYNAFVLILRLCSFQLHALALARATLFSSTSPARAAAILAFTH